MSYLGSHNTVTSSIEMSENMSVISGQRQIYVELQLLKGTKTGKQWEQAGRWITYEECVEEGSNNWSHPFLPIVYLPAVKTMSLNFREENVFTNLKGDSFKELINGIEIKNNEDLKIFRKVLFSSHLHQSQLAKKKYDVRFEKKLDAMHSAGILTGMEKTLTAPIFIFIRLHKPITMPELTEVSLPTKFILIYLTNTDEGVPADEIGRAFAALITDSNFLDYCYEHPKLDELENEVQQYLTKCCVLPPLWNHDTRIDPVTIADPRQFDDLESIEHEEQENLIFRRMNGLVRSGKIFGGLIGDIKRKLPYYRSDFIEIFNPQIVSATLFMYFACLTAVITFGGLFAIKTDSNMGTVECMMSALTNGVLYAFCSGQPLSLLLTTGPILIYESIVYELCTRMDWDYITFRSWIGIWVAVVLLILVATDASALLSYVTKFTEENYSLLICGIFITIPINYLIRIGNQKVFNVKVCTDANDLLCVPAEKDPATFLMSVILVVFTCGVALVLANLRNTPFFSYRVRSMIGEFAVFSTIILMTVIDYFMGLPTDKLRTPEKIEPTKSESRGWFIPPFHEKNPTWSCFAAILPAMIATILIFLGNQISVLIVCRKENKLRKGVGFHLDLFLITILTLFNSLFGLPWFNVGVLLSMGHLTALRKESPPEAPGGKTNFDGYHEQRITALLVSLLLGASVFLTPLLRLIPMPVLYGVFLYLGIMTARKLDIFHRIALFFMPVKYMPDYPFLRRVPLRRVHFYTLTQLSTFILLWTLKSFTQTALFFPVVLIIMIWVRHLLQNFYSPDELRMLDEFLPHSTPKPRKSTYTYAKQHPENFSGVTQRRKFSMKSID